MPLNHTRNWPMQIKMAIAIILTQSALSALLLFAVIGRSDGALRSHVETLNKEVDLLLRSALIDPLLIRDYASLESLIKDINDGQTITALEVLSPTGQSLASAGNAALLKDVTQSDDPSKLNWSSIDLLKKVTPITFSGQNLGSVRYALSLAEQAKQRSELVRQFITIAAVATLFATALILIAGSRMLRRVRAIKLVTDAAIEGDFSRRVKQTGNDELGRLALGINQMAESVNERLRALIKSEVLKTSYLHSAQTEQARLTALLNCMRFGIVFLNNQQELVYSNEAFRKIWPDSLPDFIGRATDHGKERALPDGRVIFESSHTVRAAQPAGNVDTEPVDDDNAIGSLWVFEDITEEKQSQITIQYLAERDSLTGLYNRRSFITALQQTIDIAPETPVALVYVDLDNFKLINDLQGHGQGDKVLIDVASKLTACTRTSDVVARIGGDEFVVLISNITPENQEQWCERLLLSLTSSMQPDLNLNQGVTCSVGIAWYPQDGATAEAALAAADEAMYDAKRAGKNAWRPFQKHVERDNEKIEKLIWDDRINKAIREEGFRVFLQGVHCVKTREIHHYEALVRLPISYKADQFYNPAQFIGRAEESGKIIQIDRWMIKNCILILSKHPQIAPIAVNMSAVSLNDPSLPLYVEEQLKQFNVAGNRLHLELTETAALSDINKAQGAVTSLQKLGCDICLDDFGSGFASLAYLKLLPVNYIKIDGLFMKGVSEDKEAQVLLRAIVDIAKSSNRKTVAEWIEDEAMLNTVKSFNIDLAQGYLLSKPVPAAIAIARDYQSSEVIALNAAL